MKYLVNVSDWLLAKTFKTLEEAENYVSEIPSKPNSKGVYPIGAGMSWKIYEIKDDDSIELVKKKL
jgi:hypothetical protein